MPALKRIDAERLKSDSLLSLLSEVAKREGIELYLVGGPVRDMLLGVETIDYDFVVIGDLRGYVFSVAEKLGVSPDRLIFSQFYTAKIRLEGLTLDFAHAREESYPEPAVLPRVRPCYSIETDLKRRDFTINAMAISLNASDFGVLIDPYCGACDLENGIIRVLHEGSFRDDPTRAFRAIRYSRRFGFNYSIETVAEFYLARKFVNLLNFSRIKNELMRLSVEPERAAMFIDVSRWRVLMGMNAPLRAIRVLDKLLQPPGETHWVAFFMLFIAGKRDFRVDRLDQVTRREKNAIKHFLGVLDVPSDAPITEIHKVLRNAPDESVAALASLKNGAWLEYFKVRHRAAPILSGEELMKLGVKKGKMLNKILKAIELERLAGNLVTREDEVKFVRKVLESRKRF